MKRLFSLPLVIFFCHVGLAQRNIATFSSITETQAVGEKVFFAANDYDYGLELYVSDGNKENLQLVKDISPGPGNSSPKQFTVMNNHLYFVAYSPKYGQSVWKSDGTAEGTQVLYHVNYSDPHNLMVFKDKLYFTTYLGSIIQTDGTPEGTKVFYQAGFTYGRIQTFLKNENYLYFTENGRTIYRDNGTTRQHFMGPLSWEDVYFKHLYSIGNSLIAIKSSTYDNVIRMYSLNEDLIGNSEDDEWVLIKKLDAPSYGDQEIDNFTVASGKLFFSFRTAYDNVPATDELWISDATESGTKAIKSFTWDRHWYESEMGQFFVFNGKVFFRSGTVAAKSLWTSDGTSEGTVKFHDVIITSPYNDENIPVFVDKDKFYFSGDMDSGNAELWVSNGTITQQLFDIQDNGGSNPHLITAAEGNVYFVTSAQFSANLWSTHPAPDISVSGVWGRAIESGSTPSLFYGTSIGACKTEQLTIHNKGLKELYLGSIFITGIDFALKQQSIPEIIGPGQSITLSVIFTPVREGFSQAKLTILSNDEDEPNYVIHLKAAANTNATEICHITADDVKSLAPADIIKPFVLLNSSVNEGQPVGTVIGEFSLPGDESASYTFSNGEGDSDNQDFLIEGKWLKSNKRFNYDTKNLYSIRIKATSQTFESEASFRINIINQSLASGIGSCTGVIEKKNFYYGSIEFNSLGHLFATTSNGRILRSMDAGQTWTVVYKSPNSLYGDIMFKGTTGYVQTNNFLLKSDDNGATWFPLYIPFTGQYYPSSLGFFFLTDKKGYVGTYEGELFFTTDGGETWETRIDDTGWQKFRDLFFLSEQNGYGIIEYGDLVKTENGGRTWAAVDLSGLGWNTRARDIWFLNKDVGFLSTENKFYKTSNGGTTWSEVPEVFSGDVGKIKFYDDKVGYLYGGYNSITFYKTTNGGETWTRIIPQTVSGPMNGVAERSGKIFVANQSSYWDDRARSLHVSSDQGDTWSVLDYFSGGNVYKIEFSSDDHAIAIGEYGAFKTINKGQTWQQATLGLLNVDDVYFTDANTMIILSGGHLYKSTDGGTTTRNVLTTEQSDPYRPAGKIYGLGGDVLFSFSWYAVYRSDDKGETWSLVSTDPGFYSQGMHFISPLIGYRINLFGSVQKTTDGGHTWKNIFTSDPNASNAFNAIFFVNETTGYSGGDYLRKTTDGGASWEKIDWPIAEIIAINFTDENHGYVVTRNGQVFETKSAGSKWSTIFYSGYGRVFDVHFRDNLIYMAGENGFMAGTTNPTTSLGIPGYINGPSEVCSGNAAHFNVVAENNYQTKWTTSGRNIEDHNGYSIVRFPEVGEYTVSVENVNSCGISEIRTKTVSVKGSMNRPNIDGPTPSSPGAIDVEYTVTNQDADSEFIWQVQGSTDFDAAGNKVVVDWSAEATQGMITVLAVSKAGCRADGSLDIQLDLAVGTESELQNHITLYPNPAETEAYIHSSHNLPILVRVVDTFGREYIRLKLAAAQKQALPIRQLSPGLYLVEISNGVQTVSKKLIKK